MTQQLPHLIDPSQTVDHFIDAGEGQCFTFDFRQYYLPKTPKVTLFSALVSNGERRLALIGEWSESARQALRHPPASAEELFRLGQDLCLPVVELNGAWRLSPVTVAKPWGQEIWYTGVEERGQSGVSDGSFEVPLPWLLALAPQRFLDSESREPNLLKILDPLPEPVYGDLYFELHEEKREVYVVTHVDPTAWPDGRGAIRFGFDPAVYREYDDDRAFRAAFRGAVADYEAVRREIDRRLDECRRQAAVGLSEPVPVSTLKEWLSTVPDDLKVQEREKREAMNRFTRLQSLAVGDVVKVPVRVPHALQHGVRTVEFQTPVYERKILSFAQKVLTQDHWDTEEGVALMETAPASLPSLAVLEEGEGYRLEQVAAFDDFQVERLTLEAGSFYTFPRYDGYRLVMPVAGAVHWQSEQFGPEQAFLVPRCSRVAGLRAAIDAEPAVVLLARPS